MDKNVLYYVEGNKSILNLLIHIEKKTHERIFIAWDPTIKSITDTIVKQGKTIVGVGQLSRGEGVNPIFVIEVK